MLSAAPGLSAEPGAARPRHWRLLFYPKGPSSGPQTSDSRINSAHAPCCGPVPHDFPFPPSKEKLGVHCSWSSGPSQPQVSAGYAARPAHFRWGSREPSPWVLSTPPFCPAPTSRGLPPEEVSPRAPEHRMWGQSVCAGDRVVCRPQGASHMRLVVLPQRRVHF